MVPPTRKSQLRKPLVRIATGDFAGRRLAAAAAPTRPATARMRDSIFNRPDVLALLTQRASRVVDLYAGSGLLGLEALSNGAGHVDFVERDRRACEVIRRNLETLDCTARARVLCSAVETARALEPPYDLCFADPPYPDDAAQTLIGLAEAGLVAEGGLLLWRYLRKRPAPPKIADLALVEERRYGDGVLGTFVPDSNASGEPAGR